MSLDRHPNVDPAIATAAAQALLCRNRLADADLLSLAGRLDHVIYTLNYMAHIAEFGTPASPPDPPHSHGPPPHGVLVRIEILDPATRLPKWLQQWNGARVTTHWARCTARPDPEAAEDLDARGGYTWHGQWEEKFRSGNPVDVASEIVDCQRGAGLHCHFLPPGEPA